MKLENGNWVYLSTIFDDQSSKILAKKVSKNMTSELVCYTLIEAQKKNKKPAYLHSDMGSQYTSFNGSILFGTDGIHYVNLLVLF